MKGIRKKCVFFIYQNIISQTVVYLQHQKREFILHIAGIEVSNMAHAMYATKDVCVFRKWTALL